MPVLKYWDVATGYGAPCGPPGAIGPTGVTGPTGPAGVFPVTALQGVLGTIYVGSAPPAGTRLKLLMGTYVVTTSASSLATISLSGWAYGYVAVAMVGDTSPSTSLGITIKLASCSLSTLVMTAWNNNSAGINSTAMRFNVLILGA